MAANVGSIAICGMVCSSLTLAGARVSRAWSVSRAGVYRFLNDLAVGWEVHHVVEHQDLERLGIASQFPVYEQQLSVILSHSAHVDRINNILRNRNPSRYSATANDLLSAYQEAYELIGNYTGSGEALIRKELLGIVHAAFRLANAR